MTPHRRTGRSGIHLIKQLRSRIDWSGGFTPPAAAEASHQSAACTPRGAI